MISVAAIRKKQGIPLILGMLSMAMIVIFFISLSIGQLAIPAQEIFAIALTKLGISNSFSVSEVNEIVLWNIRLPRLIMTVLIGAALGVSGAALQGLFRNPLVESGLIGVSGGAALAVVSLIVFGSRISALSGMVTSQLLMPIVAFGGGLLATLLVVKIGAQLGRTSIAILVLSGVAVNALAAALMGFVIFYADDNQLRMFTFWTLGDLGGSTWQNLLFATPLLVFSCIGLLSHQRALNAIALGESEAFHMGVDVERVKKSIIFFCALAVGISVSLAGIIGFVGLVVPHLMRIAFQADNRLVMPASLLGGPLLLVLADLLARTIAAPAELPIGVVTALVGAPFFILLLIRSKAKNELLALK
jgi:iron complex transport system permease protein